MRTHHSKLLVNNWLIEKNLVRDINILHYCYLQLVLWYLFVIEEGPHYDSCISNGSYLLVKYIGTKNLDGLMSCWFFQGKTIDKQDLLSLKPAPKMRSKGATRPRPKTIHIDSGSVQMAEGMSSRGRKGSTSNLTGKSRFCSSNAKSTCAAST